MYVGSVKQENKMKRLKIKKRGIFEWREGKRERSEGGREKEREE